MKFKRSIIYLSIAAAVAITAFIIERPDRSRVSDVAEEYFIPDYDIEAVYRVDISQLIDGATIAREGDGWQVAELVTPLKGELMEKEEREPKPVRARRADGERVRSALGSFSGLEQGVLVSKNPDKRSLYQVGETGLRVKGYDRDGAQIFDIVIGKNGPDLVSSYIRRGDEDEVYLAGRSLMGIFSPRPGDWRDRKITSVEPSEITAIEVAAPKGSYRMLHSDEGKWEIEGSTEGKADDARIKEFAKKLAALKADGFADDADIEKSGLKAPGIKLTLVYKPDKTAALKIGGPDESGKYHASLDGREDVYLISKEFVESIPPKPPTK